MRLPFPLLWCALLAMWLVLNRSVAIGDVVLGALAALFGVFGLRALQDPVHARAPLAALRLAGVVMFDIVRSNIEVAAIVLRPQAGGRRAGFVDIPLDLRHPAGLAVLACIITATPGTSWAGYTSQTGVLTMHILDLVDDETWIRTIKERYERRLLEIFR